MRSKKKINIIAGITLGLILAVYLLFWYESRDYEVQKYPNHVEIVKYKGQEKEVVIPASLWGKKVTVIQRSAFIGNDNITSVKLPRYLEQIGWGAFYGCENLESVEFGENVKAISNSAFSGCIRLKEVNLNVGLVGIGEQAFWGTKNLKVLEIPASVEKIGDLAFEYSGLNNVIFHGKKTCIGKRAFRNTVWQENQGEFVICGDNVMVCYNGTKEIVQIPYGTKYLSGRFEKVKNLKEIYLPETVVSIIDVNCLRRRGVTVYIPTSVVEIRDEFNSNDDLKSVTIVTVKGSYAEKFAKENGIKCKIVDEITYPDITERE